MSKIGNYIIGRMENGETMEDIVEKGFIEQLTGKSASH